MEQTSKQFDAVILACKDIFLKKNADYGTSWRILRGTTITDQLFIKARRIRGIETKGYHLVNEGIEPEYIGIINYAVMGLIQMQLGATEPAELPVEEAESFFDQILADVKALMLAKNHDYGEAWREMRISSFTDMILVRLLRIRQIEENQGKTLVSEGIDANYMDIINYAIFALIRLGEAA
ncbi:MAG: DUF1599 domain-containing protein [Bacteroidia bacterium]|nr:DUF1599 domain-containing protein [Bacteroidia bacterium]MCC6769115.1 DUF1599 domain-containing protein [Bacteroidia bacterium]